MTSFKEDRRQKVMSLTKKGEKIKDKAMEKLPELASCFTVLSSEEAMTLKNIKQIIYRSFRSREIKSGFKLIFIFSNIVINNLLINQFQFKQ